MTTTTTTSPKPPIVNRAAWLESEGAQVAVKDAPLWECEPNEVLIKNRFVAINPADTFMQVRARFTRASLRAAHLRVSAHPV